MFRTSLLLALISLFLGAGFAPEASAQSVGFSIGKRTQRGSVELHVSSDGYGASYSRSCATPRFSPTGPRYSNTGYVNRGSTNHGYRGREYRGREYRRPYPVRRVWVPAHCHRDWIPARYETRYDSCGRPYRVCVSPGRYVTRCSHGTWR